MDQPSSGQSPADFDYDTDQSMRVARRMAHGVYRLSHGNTEIGEEVWGIFALLNGRYRLMTDINLRWPVPNEQRVQMDVDTRWSLQGLWAEVDLPPTRRMASYVPSDGNLAIEITEARLHEDEQRGGKTKARLRSTASPVTQLPARLNAGAAAGKLILQRQVPYSPTTHLDFASTLFNFIILQQLQLVPGGSASFDSIVLSLPSLEPRNIQQTYRYDQDEALGSDMTRRHSITEPGSPDTVTTFWTDMHGIVLRQELQLEGALHVAEMINYRWQD